MKKCVNCGNISSNFLCESCHIEDLETFLKNMIQRYKEYSMGEYFYYNEKKTGLLENIVFELTEKMPSPKKEYYRIISMVSNFYFVHKENRDYVIQNGDKILESPLFTEEEKNIIKTLLMDCYYKNYQYFKAEEYAQKLINQELNARMMIALGEYFEITRRYKESLELFNKALELEEDLKDKIETKILECEKRKTGKEYLPLGEENRKVYERFMKSLNKEIILPKNTKMEYSYTREIKKAGFKTFIAFDLETTGLDPLQDSITEIAAIKVIDGKIMETKDFIFSELVHPHKKQIPPEVEQITGITNEMVEDAREIDEVFSDFLNFIEDYILLGYNCINFDSKFLMQASKISNKGIKNSYFDVMYYVSKFKTTLHYENKTLACISNHLGIVNPKAHRALADAITTANVYLSLLELEEESLASI